MAYMDHLGYVVPGQKIQRGSWSHERTLGQGGFGVVDLWQNEVSLGFTDMTVLYLIP